MPVAASGPVSANVPPTRIGCACCAAAMVAQATAASSATAPTRRRIPPRPIVSSPALRRSRRVGLLLASLFEIADEILRHRRPPAIQRFVQRIVLRLPRAVARNAIYVAEILGQAVPRIAHVVEEVGADDVAAEAPAVAVAG